MPITRFENIGIVVTDIRTTRDFFIDLGLSVQGETTVSGPWVDQTLGLIEVESQVCVLGVGEGSGQIELQQYISPEPLPGGAVSEPNALGLRRVSFAVRDLDAIVQKLSMDGYPLRGAIAQYRDFCRLCCVQGPDGILVMLFEPLDPGTSADE